MLWLVLHQPPLVQSKHRITLYERIDYISDGFDYTSRVKCSERINKKEKKIANEEK